MRPFSKLHTATTRELNDIGNRCANFNLTLLGFIVALSVGRWCLEKELHRPDPFIECLLFVTFKVRHTSLESCLQGGFAIVNFVHLETAVGSILAHENRNKPLC
jgi:hypothetical protein